MNPIEAIRNIAAIASEERDMNDLLGEIQGICREALQQPAVAAPDVSDVLEMVAPFKQPNEPCHECEKLRKDAERYRWLRDPCSGAERVVMYGRGDYGRGFKSYTALDESIDAAMQESQP